MMIKEKNVIKVDSLRMINSTNTQLRRLEVISAITKEVGKRKIPLELLKLQMIKWSRNLESVSETYSKKNGRLVINNKVTSAFNKYIPLIKEMGIIHQFGSLISLTTKGRILFELIKESNTLSDEISKQEKLFYLHLLFSKDADYLLLILDMLLHVPFLSIQSELQKRFKEELLYRLDSKSQFADRQTLSQIQEKKRVVSTEWQNAKSYSEHIIAPRLEWLIDLNILKRENNKYAYTKEGVVFMESFFNIGDTQKVSFINNNWMKEKAFNSFSCLFANNSASRKFKELDDLEQSSLLGECFLASSKLLKSGSALRVSLQPSLLFSTIYAFYKKNVIIEFSQLIKKLEQTFVFDRKQFQIKNAARITEAYIIIKMKSQ